MRWSCKSWSYSRLPLQLETLIREQTTDLFSIPFALLLWRKGARGRGRGFCIAGGTPGQCIGKVLFVGSFSTIAPSVNQHAYLWYYLCLINNNISSFSKHGNNKIPRQMWDVFHSFAVKHIKVFWIFCWNQPVHKCQIINYYCSALGLPEENEYSRLSASSTAGSSIQRHRESHTTQVKM